MTRLVTIFARRRTLKVYKFTGYKILFLTLINRTVNPGPRACKSFDNQMAKLSMIQSETENLLNVLHHFREKDR